MSVVFLIKPCTSIIAPFQATEFILQVSQMINEGKVKLKILVLCMVVTMKLH